MKIEKCKVKVTSKEEFKKVEKVCFKNDIGWNCGGKEHQDSIFRDEALLMDIDTHSFATSVSLTYIRDIESVSSNDYISYDTFMSKYDTKNKADIKPCEIKITSRTEFNTVSKICKENGLEWYTLSEDNYEPNDDGFIIIEIDDDLDLMQCSYDEDNEADYISYNTFMSRYKSTHTTSSTKDKEEIKIEECEVKVSTEEEFNTVRDICLKNGVEWWRNDDYNYNPKSDEITLLEIDDDYELVKSYYSLSYDGNYITFKEFMSKYGKGVKMKTAKYRIRTKQEFIDKFGDNWREDVRFEFTHNMDGILNRQLTNEEIKNMFDVDDSGIRIEDNGSNWRISKDMIIEMSFMSTIKDKLTTVSSSINSTINSSVGKTKPIYRIKTEKEVIEEFGENWRTRVNYGFFPKMDYLLGGILTPEEVREYLDEDEIDDIDGYSIGKQMIIKEHTTLGLKIASILCKKEKVKFKLNNSLYKRNKPNLTQDNYKKVV